MIIEIEYYKGDVLLYRNNISEFELQKQLIEIENSYDMINAKIILSTYFVEDLAGQS